METFANERLIKHCWTFNIYTHWGAIAYFHVLKYQLVSQMPISVSTSCGTNCSIKAFNYKVQKYPVRTYQYPRKWPRSHLPLPALRYDDNNPDRKSSIKTCKNTNKDIISHFIQTFKFLSKLLLPRSYLLCTIFVVSTTAPSLYKIIGCSFL
jgi:hypothetical protein